MSIKKESPLDIIRTLRGLRSSFGKVRVTFGEPLELITGCPTLCVHAAGPVDAFTFEQVIENKEMDKA